MRITSVVLGLVLVGHLAAASPELEPGPRDAVAELLGLLGEPPRDVTMTTHTADGPVVRVVPWHEVRAALEATSLGTDLPAPLATCGLLPFCPGVGYGDETGPFCDTLSAWVAHEPASPGLPSAYTQLVASGPSPRVICGGFYGPASEWDLVEMSPLAVAPGVRFDGCYALQWINHASGGCPGPKALDSYSLWRFHGTGVAATFDLGPLRLDYFLGTVGVACRDTLSAPVIGFQGCP